MFHMPSETQGVHTTIKHGFVAVSTSWTKVQLKATLTMRLTIVFKEVSRAKGLFAIPTNKMFWMKHLSDCLQNLSNDGLSTSVA
jgi:hypothetical protein